MSSNDMDLEQMKESLAAAIAARRGSLTALRERIVNLLDPVPVGVKLAGDDGSMIAEIVRVHTGASQWSNRTWDVEIRGWGLIDKHGRLIAEVLDGSYWDGNNMHHRTSEPTCLGLSGGGAVLRWATGAQTREVATALPAAIARYMAECEAEREANAATLRD